MRFIESSRYYRPNAEEEWEEANKALEDLAKEIGFEGGNEYLDVLSHSPDKIRNLIQEM